MLKYVDSVASQQVPPPYQFPGTTVHAFIWEPNLSKVKAYCNRFLNIGDLEGSGVYDALPIWPYAALLIIEYPVMSCADPDRKTMYTRKVKSDAMLDVEELIPFAERGYTSQTEIFVTFPLLRRGRTLRNLPFDTMIEWAIPLIIVENPESAICGREMLGLQKLCADKITISDDVFDVHKLKKGNPTGAFHASVSLPGWASDSPAETQKTLSFFEATAGPLPPNIWASPNETSLWSLLRSRTASRAIEAVGVMRDFLDDALMGLLPTTMQVVSLKQFRDARDPSQAVYQALVSCRSKFSSITDFRFYNERDICLKFHNRGSFCAIIEELFDAEPNESQDRSEDKIYQLPALGAFRFNAHIDFDQMRTVHTFHTEGASVEGPPDDWIVPWLRPWKGMMTRRKTSETASTGSAERPGRRKS